MKDDKDRYHVAYTATVRITLTRSGAFRGQFYRNAGFVIAEKICSISDSLNTPTMTEDCGAGDAIDRSLGTASGHAIKGAITDAMKRAARHFGEKTGNALYHSGFNANNAPKNLKDAFEQFDVQRAKSRFGFEKDRVAAIQNSGAVVQTTNQYLANNAAVKQEVKAVPNESTVYSANQAKSTSAYTSNQSKATPTNAYVTQQSQRAMAQPKPTTYATNNTTVQKTPYNNNAASQNNAKPATGTYVTPYHVANTAATTANKTNRVSTGSVDFSLFNANPVSRTTNSGTNATAGSQSIVGKENSNPQQASSAGGLNLLPRPGTSRGQQSNIADGMLGLASSILAMNGQTDNTAVMSQKAAGGGVKNPYNALG